jgi:hypothetical protein
LAGIPVFITPTVRSLQIDDTPAIPAPLNVNRLATGSGGYPPGTLMHKELRHNHREVTITGIS